MRPINAIVAYTALAFCLPSFALAQNVRVDPAVPTPFDFITIHVSGGSGYGPVTLVDSAFHRNANALEVDMTLRVGMLTVVTQWEFDKGIGILPEGSYDLLTVVGYTDTPLTREVRTSFRVVPEPSAIGLFLGATILLAARRRPNRSH